MPIRLDASAPDFAARFHAFLATKREGAQDVEAAVREILAAVAQRGDAALIELTQRFDRLDLNRIVMRAASAEIDAAAADCEVSALDALKFAHHRITAY